MAFVKRRSCKEPYSFFASFDYCVPGPRELTWIVLLFIFGGLLGNAATFICGRMFPVEVMTSFATIVSYTLMFVPVMVYASVVSRRNMGFTDGVAVDSRNFGHFKPWMVAVLVSLITIAAAYASEIFAWMLPPMPDYLKEAMDQLVGGPVLVTLLSVSVLAPIFEEWLCRGMILRGLLQRMSPSWAILLSAFFFALIHLNLWQAVPAFILGCLFGYVYYKTGSIKLTMLMHCVNNTLSVLLSRVPAFEDVEYFKDIMSPWAYWLNYAAFVLVIVSGLIILRSIPKPAGQKSACRHIPLFNDGDQLQ